LLLDNNFLSITPKLSLAHPGVLESIDILEVLASLLDSFGHRLLPLTNPDTRVVVLLVGLIFALRIANLRFQVTLLLLEVVPHADEIGKLGVGVNIHLDNTVVDGGVDFLLSRAGSTMEDKVQGLLILTVNLLLDVALMQAQNLRLQLDVTGL